MHLSNGSFLQGGKYRIVRFISSGGFGCTYEAFHVMLEKRVAIKEFFVKDFCNRDENTAYVTVGTQSKKGLVTKLRKKFVDEAKALCRLSHPGIVQVSDVFEENGTAYFVMDYVDDQSLSEMVNKNGRLPEALAKRYMLQVCDALGYVHSNNRLHLDIKPANIMVNQHGNAVLIDFGASKQYDEESGENTSTLMGKTPGYAPPEQMGNEVMRFLPATDIYALGATFCKLVTGITPPSANQRIAGEPLPTFPSDVSQGTRRAIERALQLNKKMRPQQVSEFVSDFSDGRAGSGSGTRSEAATEIYVKPEKPSVENHREPASGKGGFMSKFLKYGGIAVAVLLLIFVLLILAAPEEPQRVENKMLTIENQSVKYTGEVNSEGLPHGQGVAEMPDGKYEGTFENGVRSGKAKYTTNDGSNSFDGTYANGHYFEGRLTYDDGTYFEGKFKDDAPYNGTSFSKDGTKEYEVVSGEIQ